MKRSIKWEKWENNFVADNSSEDEDGENLSTNHVPFIQTPYGGISIKMFAPDKNNLNFWCGHTNFDLQKDFECKAIDDTPGVEIVDFFSSYRFRICVGLNFNPERVKKDIELRLGCVVPKIKNYNVIEVQKAKLDLQKNGKPWLIYILPNGKFEKKSFDDIKEFNINYNNYSKTKSAIGGKLLYGV